MGFEAVDVEGQDGARKQEEKDDANDVSPIPEDAPHQKTFTCSMCKALKRGIRNRTRRGGSGERRIPNGEDGVEPGQLAPGLRVQTGFDDQWHCPFLPAVRAIPDVDAVDLRRLAQINLEPGVAL